MERKIIYRDRIDHKILFIMVSLIAFGLVMIYSVAISQDRISLFYKQLACMSAGFAGVFVMRRIKLDYFLYVMAIPVYVISYGLTLLLLAPEPITVNVNGATRWLKLGPVNFQVAEYVKLAVILILALWIEYARYRRGLQEEIIFVFGGWLLGAIPAGLLMVISNDLSSSLVVLGITFVMVFVSSRGWTGWIMHIMLFLAAVAGVIVIVMYVERNMPDPNDVSEVSFRIGRIAAWLHPERYANTIAYQSVHCLYAIANGGWFGKGLGQSWQKASLPESENDVIFAILVEELGIFGGLVMLFLFMVLVTLIFKVAMNQKNLFSKMVCTGVGAHMVLQVVIHCGVCMNLIPNTGIGLPFFSSGLTAALFQLAEMTIVLSAANVHIFGHYNRARELVRSKKRKKTQRFFMGRKLDRQASREAAMSRVEEIGRKSGRHEEGWQGLGSQESVSRRARPTPGNGRKSQSESVSGRPSRPRRAADVRKELVERKGTAARMGSRTRSADRFSSRDGRIRSADRFSSGDSGMTSSAARRNTRTSNITSVEEYRKRLAETR
ncbi:MAG: FtsW/RodA/SpoVE family cell cycle protein, partial [Eubacterium sp.]|nr:FtsW/RodA/SpoVE family cell cycle protein [Eubacterium sp.]